MFQPRADLVVALLLADGRGAPVGLDRVGQQVGVGNVAPVAQVVRQVEDVPFLGELALEGKIQLPQLLQLGVFANHRRPGKNAEHREQGDDDLADGVGRHEDLPDVDGGEEGRGQKECGHVR